MPNTHRFPPGKTTVFTHHPSRGNLPTFDLINTPIIPLTLLRTYSRP
jgi:hypothetical protein